MARFIPPAKARETAYRWHGGQNSPLYAFASSGLVADLQALLGEVSSCLALNYISETERRGLKALHRFISSGYMVKTPNQQYPYAAPWAK